MVATEMPYRVRLVRFEDGERFYFLINNADGIPLFLPTLYATTMLRQRDLASNSIKGNMRAVMGLYTWADGKGVDIEERIRTGDYLCVQEVNSLVAFLGCHFGELEPGCKDKATASPARARVPSLERYRARRSRSGERRRVVRSTFVIRLLFIMKYLEWLDVRGNDRVSPEKRQDRESAKERMISQIKARIKGKHQIAELMPRQGLTSEAQEILKDAVRPGSPRNPWKNGGLQKRNQLIIMMLLALGIRRGELLGLTIDRIDFQQGLIAIIRNPDDPADPRVDEPNAKTRERSLKVDEALSALILDYILQVRSKIPGARKHKFLIVAHDSGAPLAFSSLTKIFATLRTRVPGLPGDLCAHMLRHTWNDHFSEMMDNKKVPEADEMKLRSYLMGWKETSKSAVRYTRRWIRKRARETGLQLQSRLFQKE